MAGQDIIDALFDKKLLTILRFFINNPDKQYYLRELAKLHKIPPTTVFRILKRLKRTEVIDEIRIKKFKIYQLKPGEGTIFLTELLATKRTALEEFIQETRTIQGIDSILLHGQETAERASLLIIGTNIDVTAVQHAVLEIKRKYNYNILHLTLEPAQFEQMTTMGLYPGKKVVLYRR
ncbi:MAG: winged helix-turn-helix domain-containing protein [Nanoarchaeota archaeon]